MFASLSESLVGVVSRFAAAAGASMVFEEPCYFYRLEGVIEVTAEESEGTRRLNTEDATVVDGTWKYRSAYSLARIQDQIASSLTLGVEAPDGQVRLTGDPRERR